jgi:tetratricopeptide (TPR) repeat protein
LFFYGAVFSQERQLKKANEAFDKYAYIEAREMYLKVLKKGYRSAELYEKLGDTYYYNSDLESAAQWYKVLLGLYPRDIKPEYLEKYTCSLKNVSDFKENIVQEAFTDIKIGWYLHLLGIVVSFQQESMNGIINLF